MKEYTVAERYEIVVKALPMSMKLSKKVGHDLEEILYTAHEAGRLFKLESEDAMLIWQLVELAKTGKVTKEMCL